MNLTLLTYTNSKVLDLHQIYFDKLKKYFNPSKQIVLCDKELKYGKIPTLIYDNNSKYYEQMITALKEIKTDYLIYSQEDYILFDYVKKEKIKKYLDILNKDKNISFIRLIHSGVNLTIKEYNDELFYLNPEDTYYFSTQITIWRKKDLIDMFNESKVDTVWDEPKNSYYLKILGKIGLCVNEKGNKVGNHYNSSVYPYIATAVIKGKWNYLEYENQLSEIHNEYQINKHDRGFI